MSLSLGFDVSFKPKDYVTAFDIQVGKTTRLNVQYLIRAFDKDTALARGAQKAPKGCKILTAAIWESKTARTIDCVSTSQSEELQQE